MQKTLIEQGIDVGSSTEVQSLIRQHVQSQLEEGNFLEQSQKTNLEESNQLELEQDTKDTK
jgi:hypothetical protein